MTQHRKLSPSDSHLLRRVEEVLHYLWDPIGISDVPEARDEYTSYAGVVFSLLKQGASEADIVRYMKKIRVEHMGMGSFEDRSNEVEMAALLIQWKDVIDEKKSQD